ncbi:MAG: hypothetical protein DIU67_005990 [Actinomycetes bacterium]|jgi:hypothetical protein
MQDSAPAIILTILILSFVLWWLYRARAKTEQILKEGPKTAFEAGLSTADPLFTAEMGSRAPVAEFTVRGGAMHVTFDVPLPQEKDEVLEELLLSEAVEVVREKRHSLPLGDLEEIVVHAGRGEVVEIGRVKLPSKGELPPPPPTVGVDLRHIAHDPFAAHFEEEDRGPVVADVKVDAPDDELPPIAKELRIPKSLERGLRALGIDPAHADGADIMLGLLRMFGYTVTEQALPGSYLAIKDGQSTYVFADTHEPGEALEVEETVIRKFLADFSTSGADRGLLLSEKYAPFSIHEIENRQPKVRFITRERIQRFIDTMALG